MTALEVFNKITETSKWYAGFTSPQNATNIKRQFEAKQLSFKRLSKMFNHFGYKLTASWDKKED